MKTRFGDHSRAAVPLARAHVLTLAVASALAVSPGYAAERSTTSLSFATEKQPLFGSSGGQDEVIDLDLEFFETRVPQTQKGQIARVTEEIPVEALQNIWQKAMNTCLAQSYTVPVINWKITPTSSECQTGKISRPYCTVPPKLSHSFPCADKRTYNRNVGAGIGPKPTQPADRPYDVGAIVTYSADVRMGVRGLMTLDGGSVDVAFGGDATLETSVAEAKPGDVVTLETGWSMRKPAADMVSRYPAWDVSLGSYVFADIKASAVYAGVDFETGEQIRATKTLYDAQTLKSDLENTSADGIVEFADTEWFGVNLSPAGLVVRVLEQGVTVADGSSLIKKSVYYPFTPESVPPPPVRFSLADYMLISPKLDTPAIRGFNCGDCSEPALRNHVDAFGRIVNTTPVGPRTLVGGLPSDDGLPFIDNALQDADFFRFDLDIDSISLALAAPLGVNVEGPPIKLPKRLRVDGSLFGPSIGFNLEALDLDVASFFSADQRLSFDPNLVVDLRFSKPVDVRLEGESGFRNRSSVSIRLGERLSFRQVPGGVTITPTYSARDNRFVNDTRIKYALALQETFGQFELYGVIPAMALGTFDLPQNFAIFQLTPELFEPITIWGSQDDPDNPEAYALGGFADVVGAPIKVADAGGGIGGDFTFELRKSSATGCTSIPATLTLASPAPVSGTSVTISDTLAAAMPPQTVSIPAGETSRRFSIKSSAVAESESGTVSATLGGTTLSQPLTLRPIGVASIVLAASAKAAAVASRAPMLSGTDGAVLGELIGVDAVTVIGGQDVAAIAKLDCTAAPGDIFVELSSTDPAVANPTMPGITIPAGTRTGEFTIKTAPVGATAKPKIVAEANGDQARRTLVVTP